MGISERKEREKEQRRQDIIDAAERIFFSRGYENATMADIAKDAELSKGTLYLYFTNKNELCMAITIRGLEIFLNKLKQLKNSDGSGVEKFHKICETYLTFSCEHTKYYEGLLNFRQHYQNCPMDGRYFLQGTSCLQEINSVIREIVEEGKNDGTIKAEVDSTLMAELIWGNQNGILPGYDANSKDLIKSGKKPQELLQQHFQLLTAAIER